MKRISRINLDNPEFRGRLREPYIKNRVITSRTSFDGMVQNRLHSNSVIKNQDTAKYTGSNLEINEKSTDFAESRIVPAKSVTHHHYPKTSSSKVLWRHSVEKVPRSSYRKHRRPLKPLTIGALVAVFVLSGIVLTINTTNPQNNNSPQVKGISQVDDISKTKAEVSEIDNSDQIKSYEVASDLPKTLTIQKIQVSAMIKKLGLNSFNMLEEPRNIYDVGWYDKSAKPGENGTIVFDGHISGPTKNGVLYNIGSLNYGDKISITRGDDKIFTYSVVGSEAFENDKVDMSKLLTSAVAGKPGLNMISCTGRFNVRTNSFEQRVVIYAVLD